MSHRDEDTWGYYLLEAEEQGLNPDYTVADGGKGIRAGQKAAWGDKPCHGDVWHLFDQCDRLRRNLAKKAQGATTQREKLEQKMEVADGVTTLLNYTLYKLHSFQTLEIKW